MSNVITSILSTIVSGSRRMVQAIRFGKDDTVEYLDASQFGIDSGVPKNTPLVTVQTSRGTYIVGAVLGHKQANDGELNIYSTDKDGKNLKSIISLKTDGTIELNDSTYSSVRYEKLEAAFNEIRKDLNDLINLHNTHIHLGTAGSVPVALQQTTSRATRSVADITPSKSPLVKLS